MICSNEKHKPDIFKDTDLMKTILDLSSDQITVADGQGRFVLVNKSSEEFFGIKEEDFIGKTGSMMEENGVFDISATAEVFKTGNRVNFIQVTKAGKKLLVWGYPIYKQDGELDKIINISKDITEQEDLRTQLNEQSKVLERFRREYRDRKAKIKDDLVANGAEMIKLYETIDVVADIDANITLMGETGVGKTHIAEYIHSVSKRKENPFITVNCGAIPEHLLESELFGYIGGSFTGASTKGRIGLLEMAGNGTIFLDEIGDLPLNMQVKLLRVIEKKKYMKIGSTEESTVNARIISATNLDLEKMVQDGKFREDLYFRLNLIPLVIPPLRTRKDDIVQLSIKFLDAINEKYNFNKELTDNCYEVLLNYHFPGNIRELKNIIERACLISTNEIIESDL
ncbi:MAG: sigma 54-interacting transcriptional regulator, partial [Tissierellia bacterium]|nr:sigma 54-interacting transcriptional regulator [Tissierellia bacterium]